MGVSLSQFSKPSFSAACTLVPAGYVKYIEIGLFTYTDRRTGLPVVSVIHLYAGYFVIPLELISRVALKRDRIPRLTAVSTTAAIHWYAWVPTGCSDWAYMERRQRQSGECRRKRRAITKIKVTQDIYGFWTQAHHLTLHDNSHDASNFLQSSVVTYPVGHMILSIKNDTVDTQLHFSLFLWFLKAVFHFYLGIHI